MRVPCCSPLLEAKDGVEPSFQDLQSDTFPLCYLAKPASPCAKAYEKAPSSFPAPPFFFDIIGGGREEGTTSFSFALLNLPFLIENSKPLHYWTEAR